MGDLQHDLALDPELACQKLIDGLVHAALGGVLDRHHAEAGGSARDCFEDVRNRRVFSVVFGGAEELKCRRVGPRTELAEERDRPLCGRLCFGH